MKTNLTILATLLVFASQVHAQSYLEGSSRSSHKNSNQQHEELCEETIRTSDTYSSNPTKLTKFDSYEDTRGQSEMVSLSKLGNQIDESSKAINGIKGNIDYINSLQDKELVSSNNERYLSEESRLSCVDPLNKESIGQQITFDRQSVKFLTASANEENFISSLATIELNVSINLTLNSEKTTYVIQVPNNVLYCNFEE